MALNLRPRMKRKGFEDVDDDFSDFPFASPATKIRRLDAELPPMVIVDEEPAAAFDQPPPEQTCNNLGSWKIEELPNEERAIVLYNPNNNITTPIVHSPSNFSVSLHPQLISGWKDQILRAGQSNNGIVAKDEDEDDSSRCQAVVPWIPPRFPLDGGDSLGSEAGCSEMVDDVEMGEAAMDVEDGVNANKSGMASLNQWQQHCTIVQPPHNTSTPILWFP